MVAHSLRPTDIDLSLKTDIFDFAMPATRHDNFLRLTAAMPERAKA